MDLDAASRADQTGEEHDGNNDIMAVDRDTKMIELTVGSGAEGVVAPKRFAEENPITKWG